MRLALFSKGIAAGLLGLAAISATALEFRSVAEHGAVFYDTPSAQAKRLFVASKGLPVEVLVDNKDWLRVRDQSGALAWVEKKTLSAKRTVVVAQSKAEVRSAADIKASLLFTAEKAVLFDLLETGKTGWVKVRHRDGAMGYIRIEEVWGI
ncbi:SH3 domain-containing protein [Chitinimonas arctica]|uniref:SH3 domain-containing protein n=1 Tax=Chitinimonas arctica TaxID=2594795 RepID=A0A516SGT4_9NEIS|nr:SH3 domain-containing protein [Chitinimonas arctica]QDQ27342.1 SH3 domain-containing protein [Chitinimonas arctica]